MCVCVWICVCVCVIYRKPRSTAHLPTSSLAMAAQMWGSEHNPAAARPVTGSNPVGMLTYGNILDLVHWKRVDGCGTLL